MVAAVTITTAAIDDIPAGNVQQALGVIYGKAQYAANTVGQVQGQAQWAADTAGAAAGTAQYAADGVGFLDYQVRRLATELGLEIPPLESAGSKSEG